MRVIAGIYKNRKLNEVSNDVTRPTTDMNKEMIFNTLGQFFDGGIGLDLFGGTGSLGIEALSRGLDYVYFSEINDSTYNILKSNIKKLGIEKATAFKGDYREFLKEYKNIRFDYVFLDPPYRIFNEVESIIKFMIKHEMFKEGCSVLLEMPKEINYVPDHFEFLKEKTGAASRFIFLKYRSEL